MVDERDKEINPSDDAKMIGQAVYEGLTALGEQLAEAKGLPSIEEVWLEVVKSRMGTAPEESADKVASIADKIVDLYKARFVEDEEAPVEPRTKGKPKLLAEGDDEEAKPITLPKRNAKEG